MREALNDDADAVTDLEGLIELDISQLANDLAKIALNHPAFVTQMLSGKIGTGLQRLNTTGCYENLFDVGVGICIFHLARDLQLAAKACRDAIFRPTGLLFLDNTANGGAPKAQGHVARTGQIKKDACKTKAMFDTGKEYFDLSKPNSTFNRRMAELRSTAEQVNKRLGKKMSEAERMQHLKRLLGELANQAVAHVTPFDEVLDGKVKNASVANMPVVHALVEFALAVEQVVSWVSAPVSPDRARSKLDEIGPERPSPIEDAVQRFLNGETINVPNYDRTVPVGWTGRLMPRCHRSQASTRDALIFLYRATTIKDPDHLPTGARTVIDHRTGKEVRVNTAASAAQYRGADYTYEQLKEFSPGKTVSYKDGIETTLQMFDTGLTEQANAARKAYFAGPSIERAESVRRQNGLFPWRFTI